MGHRVALLGSAFDLVYLNQSQYAKAYRIAGYQVIA